MFCLLGFFQSADAQPGGSRRETVTILESTVATRHFTGVLDLLEKEQWDDALEVLDDLALRYEGHVVHLGGRRYLDAALAAQLIQLALPDAARRRLQQKRDQQASRLLTTAIQTRDSPSLEQILKRFCASRHAAEAVRYLAEWAWEDGDLQLAVWYWRMLRPRTDPGENGTVPAIHFELPASDMAPEMMTARLITAEAFLQDDLAVEKQMADFEQKYSNRQGHLFGESGRLLDLLRRMISESRHWDVFCGDQSWAGIGLRADRNAVIPYDIDVIAPQWQLTLDLSPFAPRLTHAKLIAADGIPQTVPVVHDGIVYLQDRGHLRAVRLRDGTEPWPSGTGDGTIYRDLEPASLQRPYLGNPLFSPTVHEGRLFALIGLPVTIVASREPRAVAQELISLDVRSGQGKLLWRVTADELVKTGQWRFSGPPVADAKSVYIALRQSQPELLMGIASIDRKTGRLNWFRPVCGILAEAPSHYHIVTSDFLTLAVGRLFLATGAGCVICLDTEQGRLNWAVKDDPQRWSLHADTIHPEPSGRPAVYHRGRIFAVQRDNHTVQCFDAGTGFVEWKQTIPSRIDHVVGVRGGLLILDGRQLWGLSADTGTVQWQTGTDDAAGQGAGPALIAGKDVLWNTKEDLFVVDLVSGTIVRRIPLRAGFGLTGGRLSIAGDRLLLSSSQQITAFRIRPANKR